MTDQEREIRRVLQNILAYVGADLKYVEYAQLHRYLEWFIENVGGK